MKKILAAAFAIGLMSAGGVAAQSAPNAGPSPAKKNVGVQAVDPGGNKYSLSGVSLNPTTYIKSTQIGTADTPYGVMSMWFRGSTGTIANPGGDFYSYFVRDLALNLNTGTCNGVPCGSENTPGFDFAIDNASGSVGTVRLNFNDSKTGRNHSVAVLSNANIMPVYNGAWHQLITAWNFSRAGSPVVVFYIDGVAQSVNYSGGGGVLSAPLMVNFNTNASGFSIGGNSGNSGAFGFDAAQLFIDTTANVLKGSNGIPAGILAKFYNKGPVNFGATCSNPLGYQPQVCLDGPASTFLTNKGTSTATWSLVANPSANGTTPSLFSASYGPNATPTAPAEKWIAAKIQGIGPATAAFTIPSGGNPVVVGDTIIAACLIPEKSTSAPARAIRAPVGGSTGPAGWSWTLLASQPSKLDDSFGYAQNIIAVYSRATTSVAAGTDFNLTFNFTPGGAPRGNVSCVLLDYGPTSTVTSAYSNGGTVTTWSAPSVTPTSATSTMINMWFDYQVQSNQNFTFGSPNSRMVFERPNNGGGGSMILTVDEALTGTAPTGKRTVTQSLNRSYQALSILLQP